MDEVIMTKEKALENEEFKELYENLTDCAGKVFDPNDIDCVGNDEEEPCRFLEECRATCVADSTEPEEEEDSNQSDGVEDTQDTAEEPDEAEEAESFGVPQMIHLVEKAADVIGWTPKIKETAVRVNVYFEEADQDLLICQPGAIKFLVPYQWKNDGKSIKQWMKETSLDRMDGAEVCHGGVKISLDSISGDVEDALLSPIYEHLSTVNLFLDEYYNVHPSQEKDEIEEEEEEGKHPGTPDVSLPMSQLARSLRTIRDGLDTLAVGFGSLAEVLEVVENTPELAEDDG